MRSKASESSRRSNVCLTGILAVTLAVATTAHAQLFEGPNDPAVVVSDACVVGAGWFPAGNAVSSNDMYAQVSPAGVPTQCLKATDYGFNIPSPAEIKGIEVMIERHSSSAGTIKDSSVKIVKGGVITGTEHADVINFWPATDAVATYGGSSDLWGETWTPADINGAGFGAAVSAVDNVQTASVDVIQITVYYSLCAATPPGLCHGAMKAVFIAKDKGVDSTKDKMTWKWIKGDSVMQSAFANPLSTATYALCVYEGAGNTLIAEVAVPPDAMKWAIISTKGYKYKDKLGVEDGVTKIIVKGSSNNKSKALVKGKGAALPDVVPPLALPVTAVLVNSDTGDCFTSSFDAPDIKKNIGGLFKAVAQ